ncbi:hypothetical protein NC653_023734 [Populus alba x Populus x berolinensis]|uniref:Pentatricopeptide repeat-containing protein n=1 Tax=Populus alba x Populus x berolinensis TaxID=444605 RepID=A0AAD6MKD6_9ROSI|nr:hypothetical protein NC653_023734 [Populus alba x Populus x berolinensis]
MTLPILKSQPGVSPFVIHAQAIKSSHAKSPSVGNALLNAYVKRGNVDEASKVFQSTDEKDVAWSALISGYAQIGDTDGAIRIFVQMEKKAPAGGEQGESRFNNALFVSSVLLTMYSKRGDIESACRTCAAARRSSTLKEK